MGYNDAMTDIVMERDDTREREMALGTMLLPWYEVSRRDLPWRRVAGDPYAVWISEVMLQQTTVAAVIPFFVRWMERFPTVESLADAPIDDVLKIWAGLGYYARARNLHRGAQAVVRQHGGRIPSDEKALRALPGVGPYTAGAILSIAFNQDAGILDANVTRVLARIFAVPGDPRKSTETRDRLWELARRVIPHGRASDFNQAMMELGALVCHAAQPRCTACPAAAVCQALQDGAPETYPQFEGKKKWTSIVDVSVAIWNRSGKVLLARRPADLPLWGGLWELPRARREPDETSEECAERIAREQMGFAVKIAGPFGTVKHVVANRKVTLHGFEMDAVDTRAITLTGYDRFAWIEPHQAVDYAVSSPQVRLIGQLVQRGGQGRLDFDKQLDFEEEPC
jgi:A/G-specific adenine glycosylase